MTWGIVVRSFLIVYCEVMMTVGAVGAFLSFDGGHDILGFVFVSVLVAAAVTYPIVRHMLK